jgi:hypothetical protein
MVTKDAIIHGHSTPLMAGLFAKRVGAKRLIMNHFSARYLGDASLDSMQVMTRIEEQAVKASGLDRDSVAAAWDVSFLHSTTTTRDVCFAGSQFRCPLVVAALCFSLIFLFISTI